MSRYPLAAVLALRAREEGAARAEAERAAGEEELRMAAWDAAAARVSTQRGRLARALAGPGPPGPVAGLRARDAFLARLRRDAGGLERALGAAEGALRLARAEADARRAALAAARVAVRALERHRERWEAEAARRRGRREEAEADDQVSARRAEP